MMYQDEIIQQRQASDEEWQDEREVLSDTEILADHADN
jgi:hypothetical protein